MRRRGCLTSCRSFSNNGLAPGFTSIAANELMQHFDELEVVKMRVGALPVNPSNVLKYSLTWSTDGLINEYGNTCYGIDEGELIALQPLEGYETITLDGVLYEAFNTSGGLGTLAESYDGRIRCMNYKTMRYPGHCGQIKLLMYAASARPCANTKTPWATWWPWRRARSSRRATARYRR